MYKKKGHILINSGILFGDDWLYLCIICLSINKANKYRKLDFTAFAQTKLLIRQAEILHWYFKLESNLIIFWKEISFPKCLFFSLQCIKLMTYNFSFFCILCWESNFLCKNILMQWNIYVKIFMSLYDITFTNYFCSIDYNYILSKIET